MRKIIHVDMDAFYASVEELEHPEYKNKPLAVGSEGSRSVVATCNYVARKYGVKSAMSSIKAKRLCRNLIFVPPQFSLYKQYSQKIRNIFYRYTDLVEPLSLDEAFLDVTKNKKGYTSATFIAQEIQHVIKKETGLTASAGVSMNKFLAKVASDYQKPDGLTIIPPYKAEKFIESLPVEKFFGVGKVTQRKMKNLHIETGLDLKNCSLDFLNQHFGKNGTWYYHISRNIDNREISSHRERKSIGAERTFYNDLIAHDEMESKINKLSEEVFKRSLKNKKFGRTLTLKIKFNDFTQISRSITLEAKFSSLSDIQKSALNLLQKVTEDKPIRLLGVSVSGFENQEAQKQQLTLTF